MKKILIVSTEFYPEDNANTNCLYKIVDELIKRQYSVFAVSMTCNEKLKEDEYYRGCNIKRVIVHEQTAADRIVSALSKNKLLILLKIFVAFFLSIYVKHAKKHKAKKLIKELSDKHDFEYVISVLKPDDNHKLAYKYANKKYKWILLNFDPFVFNFYGDSDSKAKRIYKKWLKRASGVIDLEGINEDYKKHGYYPYKNIPHISVPLPNLFINNNPNKPAGGDRFTIRYTGRFYKKIRNPEPLLKLLDKIDKNRFTAEFYGLCCDYLRTEYEKLPECAELKGIVSAEKCKELTDSADILVNVGNTVTNQVPSKVFECIGSGKPIINIYYNDDDIGLKFFEKYPKVLNIRADDEPDMQKLDAFLNDIEPVPASKLREIYSEYLSENILTNIVNFIENC